MAEVLKITTGTLDMSIDEENSGYYYNGYLYVNTVTKIYRVDLINKTVTLLINKPTTEISHKAVLYNGKIYTISNISTPPGSGVRTVYAYINAYDIETNTITAYTSFKCNTFYYSTDSVNAKYVLGVTSNAIYTYSNSSRLSTTHRGIGTGIIDEEFKSYNILTNTTMSPDFPQVSTEYPIFFGVGSSNTIWQYTSFTDVTEITTDYSVNFRKNATFYRDGLVWIVGGTYDGEDNLYIYQYNPNARTLIKTDFILPFPTTNYISIANNDMYIIEGDKFVKLSFVQYNLTYEIKSIDGSTTYATLTNSAPITKALFGFDGNTVSYILTTLSGDIIGQYTPEIIEGKQLIGYGSSPNSKKTIITVNRETEVNIRDNFIFYEVYGTYRPPKTTFQLNLYQNSAEVNRVDKGEFLVGVGTLSGALREECSMLTPSIVYQSSDVPTFNYVYIPIFNRYYYVTSLSSVSKNVWRIELNCDVLMTYKNEILLLQGVIGRQENDFNPLLVDNELPTQNNPIVEVIDIPSDAFSTQTSGTGHNFLLTVIGP